MLEVLRHKHEFLTIGAGLNLIIIVPGIKPKLRPGVRLMLEMVVVFDAQIGFGWHRFRRGNRSSW